MAYSSICSPFPFGMIIEKQNRLKRSVLNDFQSDRSLVLCWLNKILITETTDTRTSTDILLKALDLESKAQLANDLAAVRALEQQKLAKQAA